MLQSMRSQRVGHDLATEQQANECTELGQQDFPGWVCPKAEPRHEVLDASHPFIWLLFPLEEASSTEDPLLGWAWVFMGFGHPLHPMKTASIASMGGGTHLNACWHSKCFEF